ncbi:MAG TPA: tetratricopeptide repeat protein, partial [Candidatus Latescibacteria bacterium]|nr:tetratricopeptide repeat protein [Candidatus Latescibacterota bacterium]
MPLLLGALILLCASCSPATSDCLDTLSEIGSSPEIVAASRASVFPDTSCGGLLFSIGTAEYAQASFIAARKAFEAATVFWPDSSKAWNGLGLANYRIRDYSAAERAFKRSLRLAPRQ